MFCLIFCGFEAKREEITNKKFKNNGKNKTDFSRANVFLTKRSETKKEFFQRFFPRQQQHFFFFGYIKNELKRRNFERRVKQNEKPFFQDTEKDKNMEHKSM